MNIFEKFLRGKAQEHDSEWRAAIKYGYDHFHGKELEEFLQIVDDIDEKRLTMRKKDGKKC